MEKTIGGDRLGSGNKMKTRLHNYERSTHDLGNIFRSTMAPGLLVPCYKQLCTNGDTWSIDLETLTRTMPAIGPLFGSYKMQIDMFEIPIRLYNGVLHNNWIKIGMDMSKVRLPRINYGFKWIDFNSQSFKDFNTYQISSSSLTCYLGMRGFGDAINSNKSEENLQRDVQCVPMLAYYDIFKNYYANKQEKNAFVVDVDNTTQTETNLLTAEWIVNWRNRIDRYKLEGITVQSNNTGGIWETDIPTGQENKGYILHPNQTYRLSFDGEIKKGIAVDGPQLELEDITDSTNIWTPYLEDTSAFKIISWENGELIFETLNSNIFTNTLWVIRKVLWKNTDNEQGKLKLKEFDLENIDKMRMEILQSTGLNNTFFLNSANNNNGYYPYKVNYEKTPAGHSKSRYKLVGLCTKTYQSDLYNNWLSREWIDGINGINAITAVDTSTGSFTIDALNLAHKVYNMLNRIAISGGTYQDWQEAVYGEDVTRMAESPIFCGELACNIQFEEVISTADTQTESAGDQPLGSLAGKGIVTNVRGGQIDIHIKEPSYIMGIVSITPLIDYCQGNDWDIMELDSLNDIHKPELDQIGFQNLMLEQAAWWGKQYDVTNTKWVNHAVGKVPAWINYMTSVNKTYGDFAEDNELGFMCLNRRYEYGSSLLNGTNQYIPVKDWTTYINPTKYNNQFANVELDAQNFWVQIGINAEARRKMSAAIIPNL